MEQMIKINVPDGMKAVWNDRLQKVEFKKVQKWKDIKTFDDVLRYIGLKDTAFCDAKYIPNLDKYIRINKWQLIMETFIEASNDQCQLTKGNIYYPYYSIVYDDEIAFEEWMTKVRSCIINNKKCTLIGNVSEGSYMGLGCSYSNNAVSAFGNCMAFCGFSSYEVAKHISKYFTWELYESTLGWRKNEIKWL